MKRKVFRLTRRIYISSPRSHHLDERRRKVRWAIVDAIQKGDFEPQVFGSDGFARGFGPGETWSPAAADAVMRRSVGVVLLGFPIYQSQTLAGGGTTGQATEYCHYEGALARTLDLPVFAALEEGTAESGAFLPYAGDPILTIPKAATEAWVRNDDTFKKYLAAFLHKVRARKDVFLGYPGRVQRIARQIARRLRRRGVKVLDWHDFLPGDSIIRRIEEAAKCTTGGLFLFTADDRLERPAGRVRAVPRDNVVFEAGYFIHAKGKARVLIAQQADAKHLSDLGGDIYVPLSRGKNLKHTVEKIESFLASQL
jgi:predicted nucleotide-binding protein with TIR-like domain